jgi:hypothetical protein
VMSNIHNHIYKSVFRCWWIWVRAMKTKHSATILSQIRRRIELCLREKSLILRWIYNIYFSLVSSIRIPILKQESKYLATGL